MNTPSFQVTVESFHKVFGRYPDEDNVKEYDQFKEELAKIEEGFKELNAFSTDKSVKMWMMVMRMQHRTHQASIIRFLRDFLKEYGKTEYFDGRNEAAVKFALKAGEINAPIPYI